MFTFYAGEEVVVAVQSGGFVVVVTSVEYAELATAYVERVHVDASSPV